MLRVHGTEADDTCQSLQLKPMPEDLVGDCWPCIIKASLLERLKDFQLGGYPPTPFKIHALNRTGDRPLRHG